MIELSRRKAPYTLLPRALVVGALLWGAIDCGENRGAVNRGAKLQWYGLLPTQAKIR
jgi:hypothetical protein